MCWSDEQLSLQLHKFLIIFSPNKLWELRELGEFLEFIHGFPGIIPIGETKMDYTIGSKIRILYSGTVKKELHGELATVTKITGFPDNPSVLAVIDGKEYHFYKYEFRVVAF
jgi:hypothetical protein